MEDNTIRTAAEKREDNNGGAAEMKDNRDVRQGKQQRQRLTSMVTEMRDNRDVYEGGGYAGRQQKRCGMTDMVTWDGGRQRIGKILTESKYQPEGISSF